MRLSQYRLGRKTVVTEPSVKGIICCNYPDKQEIDQESSHFVSCATESHPNSICLSLNIY